MDAVAFDAGVLRWRGFGTSKPKYHTVRPTTQLGNISMDISIIILNISIIICSNIIHIS